MSGFVAIIGRDGAPVDASLLDAMVDAMAFRGPDGQATWVGDGVGLGCALLRTSDAVPSEHQPATLDGEVRIVGCVRLDDRDALRTRLQDGAPADLRRASDVELVLAVYLAGGEAALEGLRGEFAFTLWDGRERRLVSLRDPFGVRPLYHARVGDYLLVSNTLEVLGLHPGVSTRLDELAICDFLMYGRSWDLDRTAFADVRRVPPAHLLVFEGGRMRLRRYWTLPDPPVAKRLRSHEVVSGLVERLERVVADRVPDERTVVFMSGGLDSTSVAAMAKRTLDRDGTGASLLACTLVLDEVLTRVSWRPMPSEEEAVYARGVADHLGIEHQVLDYGTTPLWARWREGLDLPPEPIDAPNLGPLVDGARDLARERRVGLTGEGGDSCFRPPGAGVPLLLRLRCVSRYIRERGRLPTLSLRSRLGRRLGRPEWQPGFPPWFDPDLVARHDLEGRWREWLASLPGFAETDAERTTDSRPRPEARRDLSSPWWPHAFWGWDPEVLRAPLDVRHPFFDPRLVGFLLSLPPVPWFWEKLLLRQAMKGVLPDGLRRRPKAVDRVAPRHRLVLGEGQGMMERSDEVLSGLAPYLRIPCLRKLGEAPERLLSNEIRLITRPLTLGWWLAHLGGRTARRRAGENR